MQKTRLLSFFIPVLLFLPLPAATAAAQEMKALPAPAVEMAPVPPPGEKGNLVFLELYAAENCAFCPAAERNFNDIVTGENVIGVTCMVDYFDSGAPGALSRPFCRAQQNVYARLLKTGSLYTPQLVVNGSAETPGHKLQDISAAIHQARQGTMPVELEIRDGAAEGAYDVVLPPISPPDVKEGETFLLRVMTIRRMPDLALVENARQKRERTPHNTATALVEGGLWDGKKLVWTVEPPRDGISDAFIVMVQDRDSGRILAAGQHALALSQ